MLRLNNGIGHRGRLQNQRIHQVQNPVAVPGPAVGIPNVPVPLIFGGPAYVPNVNLVQLPILLPAAGPPAGAIQGVRVNTLGILSDDLIIFVDKVSHKPAFNPTTISQFFELSKMVRAGPERISKRDYFSAVDMVNRLCGLSVTIQCIKCGVRLATQNSFCWNVRCSQYRLRFHRAKSAKKCLLRSVNLRSYSEQVVAMLIEDVLASHREIHATNRGPLHDGRYSELCRRNIEDRLSFQRNEIVLPLIFSCDGFNFSGSHKGCSWPFMAQLLSIPNGQRQKYENMMLLYLYSAGRDPPKFLLKRISRELSAFAASINRNPMVVDSSVGPVTVRIRFVGCSMDLKAHAHVFNTNGWQGWYGCPWCLLRGQRIGGAMRWSVVQPANLRTEDRHIPGGVFYDVRNTNHGFKGDISFSRIIPSNSLMPDTLHTFGEGVLKGLVKGLFEPGGRPGLTFTAIGRAKLEELSKSVYASTCARVPILDVEEFGGATGSQREAMYCTVMCASFLDPANLEDGFTAPLGLCFGLFIRKLQSTYLDVALATDLRNMIDLFLHAHNTFYGASHDTMKLHCLKHVAASLPTLGNPYSYSTSSTEAAYRRMKMSVHTVSTRSFDKQACSRLLCNQLFRAEIRRRARQGNAVCAAYLREQLRSHLDREMDTRLGLPGDRFYSPLHILGPQRIAALQGEARISVLFIQRTSPTYNMFTTRLGMADVVYGSSLACSSARETQRNWIVARVGGQFFVVSINIFATDMTSGHSIFAGVAYPTIDPIGRLSNVLRTKAVNDGTINNPWIAESLHLLQEMQRINDIYFEYIGNQPREVLLNCEAIVTPVALLQCNGRCFAVNQNSVVYHE